MPKKIDHDERKERIVQTALKVFAREGYRNANLSLIASECGISRPTIYQYFHDKDQIYYYAVKLVTGRMFNKYVSYAWDSDGNSIDRLVHICNDIIDTAKVSEGELTNLLDVMLQMKREGKDFNDIVLRRTAKLTILFKRLLRMGIMSHEVIECDVDKVSDHLLILLESCCLRVGFFEVVDLERDKQLVDNYLEFYKTHPHSTLVVKR
jgi:AcrR family transcriptional regulator